MTAVADRDALRIAGAATIRRLCQAPERLTTTEWAVKYRELPETGGTRGRYRIEVVPYHRRPQDLMTNPTVRLVVLAWGSQTGKSTCIENGIGARIHLRPSPMLMVRPKIDDAESWAKERFDPMVRATKVLRERVQTRRGVSTMRYKVFPGGYLFIPSAQSATELASRSAPELFIDEADRMEHIIGEGNPIEIVQRRNAATDLGTTVLTSTPRDAETTMIWPYLLDGTYEFFEIPCPHCGHQQPLIWGTRERDAGLRWTYGQPETAAYLCRSCLTLIDEREKPAMLLAGGWVATQPDKDYPSFHLNALYSPFGKSAWRMLAREWESSQGKPGDLQVFINTRLAEPWEEPAEVVDADTLSSRLEEYPEGGVPQGVAILTAGVDVQDNRLEVSVWGWGANLESWLVLHEQLPGDPSREPDSPGSVWRDLDAVLIRTFGHESGAELRIRTAFVDSGHLMQSVYAFTRPRLSRKVFACKGIGGPGIPAAGKPTAQTRHRVILYPVGVDTLKSEFLRSQVHERTPGPGYVHLPTWATPEYLAQLVGEKRVTRIVRGRAVREWIPRTSQTAVEGLDCRNYARASLEALGPSVIRALGTMAQSLRPANDQTPAPGESAAVTPAPSRAAPRTNWVKGNWFKGR